MTSQRERSWLSFAVLLSEEFGCDTIKKRTGIWMIGWENTRKGIIIDCTKNYCFNNKNEEETVRQIDNAITNKSSSALLITLANKKVQNTQFYKASGLLIRSERGTRTLDTAGMNRML